MPQSNEERMERTLSRINEERVERVFGRMLSIAGGTDYTVETAIQAAGVAAALHISMATAKMLTQQAKTAAAQEVRDAAREQEQVERRVDDKARVDAHMRERAARLKVIDTIMHKDNPTPEDLKAIDEISQYI